MYIFVTAYTCVFACVSVCSMWVCVWLADHHSNTGLSGRIRMRRLISHKPDRQANTHLQTHTHTHIICHLISAVQRDLSLRRGLWESEWRRKGPEAWRARGAKLRDKDRKWKKKNDERREVTQEEKDKKKVKERVLLWQHFPEKIRSDEARQRWMIREGCGTLAVRQTVTKSIAAVDADPDATLRF